jgi:hypothetical protein
MPNLAPSRSPCECNCVLLATRTGSTLHLKNELTINLVLMEQKFYSAPSAFYQTVKSWDYDQVALQAKSTVAALQ